MVAQSDKRLIWHPRGQNKFIVGGSTQITLYEWISQSSEIRQVASQLELNQMKVSMHVDIFPKHQFKFKTAACFPCSSCSASLGLRILSWMTSWP